MTIKTASIRSVIMELIKNKFSVFSFWDKMESDIAIMVSNLEEPIDEDKKLKFVKGLYTIKNYFISNGISESDLEFIDEEIKSYKETKTISLYIEEEDAVDSSVINRYANLGSTTEGVIGIHQQFNFTQLNKLTNGVYLKTGLIKFYISREKTIYGKIVAEIYEHPQKIPVASLIQSRKVDKDSGIPISKKIVLFGTKYDSKKNMLLRQINIPFYVYRMITEDNNEIILMTTSQCEIGDYIVTGCVTECDDYKMLTDSSKLPTKLPYMFAQQIRNRIIKFGNHKEFYNKINNLGIIDKKFIDFPFSIIKGNKTFKMLHPTWYKWLIWAWLLHEPKGIFNNYPLHLMVLGPMHSGKSLLLNGLHTRSKETRSVFSGSSSTLKHLVPSFKYSPARLGYLAESNRFSFCDEFLRCLINTRTTKEGSAREESVAIMNDLLEHQKRQAGSGVSQVNVNMTSRIIATSNPIRDIHNVEDLINTFDGSFLSRWLIYYQTKDHVRIIRDSDDFDLKPVVFKVQTNDWISIIDYLHTFSAEYDKKIIKEIHKSVPHILSETLHKHYDARHNHHIECIIDGIVKTRCLIEGDMSFKANEEDYKMLKRIWFAIIRSWVNIEHIKNLPIDDKIFYLPENCQNLYWKITNYGSPVNKEKSKEIALTMMSKREYNEAFGILIDMGVLIVSDGFIKPHYNSVIKNG